MSTTNKTTASTDNDWVRITSEDGYTFLVRRSVASASGTMSDSLDAEGMLVLFRAFCGGAFMTLGHVGNFAEAIARHVSMQQRAVIVDKMLDYMLFKAHYENSTDDIPLTELQDRLSPEVVLELLLGADYQNM
ncbi:hypothetical protein HMN09_00185700 [Mycena chlorophos]|uniref:Elongin-C n=1 Tax=Mycena chlorophos TaxID=658473 RepID=A0A8H6WN86_MYCCL|nr:hypothetical protein HMN09_00185700 [Mycena chlorophos]